MAIFFALLIGGIYEFLSLRGVVNIVASRIVLFGVWVIGIVLSLILVRATGVRSKVVTVVSSAIILAILLSLLSRSLGLGAEDVNQRTIVFVNADWNDRQGRWDFSVDHLGDVVAVHNIEIKVGDIRNGMASSKVIVRGMNINPEPGMPHRVPLFLVDSRSSDDERLFFTINGDRESVTQYLWLQKGRGKEMFAPWAVAARVVDGRTHRTLLACRDEGLIDLDESWNRLRTRHCETLGLFSSAAIQPESYAP